MNKLKKQLLSVLSAIVCALLMGSAFAAQESATLPATVTATQKTSEGRLWNLQDADILSIINEVSQETGKNFVVDPRVNGKISLVSSKPLKQQEVYQVFLSVLGILGYSAVPSGNIIKIVPNMESGEQTTPVLGSEKGARAKGEEVVVRVIPLENVSATQLLPILRPMLPQWSNISAYTPGNVLILLGRASNLDRILTIVQDVDKAATSGIEIIPLKHASAAQLVVVINNLQLANKAAGESGIAGVAVDERSNSLLLSGVKSARLRLRALISQLDAPSKIPSGNTEVVYLRYLEAKTFAPILGRVVQNMLGKGSSSGSGLSDALASQTTVASSGTTANAGSKEPVSTNTTNIQAEASSNALIITATPAIMDSIKKVIARLDVRPAQVLIEAIIAQVEESNAKSLGIQWGNLVSTTAAAAAASQANTSNTTTGGYAQPGVGVVGIIPGIHIQAVLSMLQTLNGVDILSTPSVMVLDNRQAVIEIGQSLPITTGQYTTQSAQQNGVATPFTTQSYRDVTLKLDVTPQINLSNAVRLKIKLKNDTVSGTVQPGQNPQINTSSINNSVMVNNEDVLVLGGLMSNITNETIDRIPLISDIPVIGRAFERKGLNRSKKNLMVFIKTSIVHDGPEGNVLSDNKYHYIKRQQTNHQDNLRTIDRDSNQNRLPPWRNPKDLPSPFEKNEVA